MSSQILNGVLFVGLLAASPLAASAAPRPVFQDEAYWAPLKSLADARSRPLADRVKRRVMIEIDTRGRDKAGLELFLGKVKSELLEELRRQNDESVQRLGSFPFLSLDLTERELRKLNALKLLYDGDNEPVKFRVEPSPKLFNDTVPARFAPAVGPVSIEKLMTDLGVYDTGKTGAGFRIVVIDEGVDPENKIIKAEVLAGTSIKGAASCELGEETEYDPDLGKNPNTQPWQLDHGTMVAAVASWAAPDADIISIRVGSGEGAFVPDVIAAILEAECKWNSEDAPVAAVVLSMTNKDIKKDSSASHYKSMCTAMNWLWSRHIPVVVSAGNDGPNFEAFPSNLEVAVTVGGALNTLNAPVNSSNWTKVVDLCAPGIQVSIPHPDQPYGFSKNGTSVAAPFVAGALAVLKEAHPKCSIEGIIDALRSEGLSILSMKNGNSVPLIQVRAALSKLNEGCELAVIEAPVDDCGSDELSPAPSVDEVVD